MLSANILVVERAVDVGQTLGHMLEDIGHHYKLVASAAEGLLAYDKRNFDVVLGAVDLSAAAAIEMMQRMGKTEPALVPVLILSHHSQEAIEHALECNIKHFLIRPFTADQLAHKLNVALLERKQLLERNQFVGNLMRERYFLQERVASQGEKLTHTESYLQNLLDASPFGIISTDMQGHIVTYNDTCRKLYGFQDIDVLSRHINILLPPPLESPEPNRTLHRRNDGSSFPVLVQYREIRDITGERIGHLYMIEDLSEREQFEEQLLYAQKRTLLGDLAPRLAHEIKTPLQLITGYSELAKKWLEEDSAEQAYEALQHIDPASKQILDMVHQMSNLAKPTKSHSETVQLHTQLEILIDELRPLGLFKIYQVECDFADGLPPIQGDPDQLGQLFRNLIVNALHAMENRPERKLGLALKLTEDGRRIEVLVSDTGTGIAPENIGKIYQPFFTTKTENKGTGLGMVVVKTIAEYHHATLRVESQEGKGTCFYLSFPLETSALEAATG